MVEDLDDDFGRFLRDLLRLAVDLDLLEDERLVPRGTQRLVELLRHLTLPQERDPRERV